jgi:phosphoribosylanthranilate isomerase
VRLRKVTAGDHNTAVGQATNEGPRTAVTRLVSSCQVLYVHPMWIKICGIKDFAIAEEIVRLKPDAVGLNFYERSVRSVTTEIARKIVDVLPSGIQSIGVFVESTAETMQQTCANCRLGGAQLHASGQSDSLSDLTHFSASFPGGPQRIRAFQIGPRGLEPLAEYFELDRSREFPADAYLVDSHVEGMYGGTGKMVSWDRLRNEYQKQEWPPLILAGGLRPENVGEAIDAVRPWGVDVASGVESAPGVKDTALVERFIEEARLAFAKLGATSKPVTP